MDMLLNAFDRRDPIWVVCALAAWFIGIGLHEGGHAIIATRLGDPLPRTMGKCSINPMRHIDWHDPNSVIATVVIPVVTVLTMGFPLGMAWVMTSLRDPRSRAKIALAGPIGSFLAACLGYVIWIALFPILKHGSEQFGNIVSMVCIALVFVNIVYAAFNLLPVPPIDGSEVLYYYMPPDGRELMNRIRPYGFWIIIGVGWILPYATRGAIDPIGSMLGHVQLASIKLFVLAPKYIWGA